MLEKLEALENRYRELEALLSDPAVLGQQSVWQEQPRELAGLSASVETYRRYKKVVSELEDAAELLKENSDSDMADFLKEEMNKLNKEKNSLEKELKELLIPKDPMDDKNVFIEIRAGTGGEEAALFAADLLKMYTRYAEQHGWKIEIVDAHATDIGGFKEVIIGVAGKGAYSRLKYESGVHRVQRIPTTESGGDPYSAATVAVPEVEDGREINPGIDEPFAPPARRAGVNTQSAVRITHLPAYCQCQDEKSQLKTRKGHAGPAQPLNG